MERRKRKNNDIVHFKLSEWTIVFTVLNQTSENAGNADCRKKQDPTQKTYRLNIKTHVR